MSHLKRWFPMVIGGGLTVFLLTGLLAIVPAFAQSRATMMPDSSHNQAALINYTQNVTDDMSSHHPGGAMGNMQNLTSTMPMSGMMGGMMGPGMMAGMHAPTGTMTCDPSMMMDMMGGMMGQGMMGQGMMGNMMGRGMMHGSSPLLNPKPLTVTAASNAVKSYLVGQNDPNLVLGKVLVFDNHAYAQVMEKDTGQGAMELLIDPVTKAVNPQMGPTMMWNTKYGMGGMMGGMMGGGMMMSPTLTTTRLMTSTTMMTPTNRTALSAEMSVTPNEAVESTQAYLNAYLPAGLIVTRQATAFHGYYTLNVERDGKTIGLVSVNGYNRQVVPQVWHGNLLETSK